MDYVLSALLLVAGFILLVKGADYFVASASSLAKRLKISSLVIGLTIVAFGTSLPELAVSFIASLTVAPGQTADIAMGNVVGSNIVNITLILGLTALANPVKISKTMHRKEFPYLILSMVIIILFANLFQSDALIVWWEAFILLILFVIYIIIMVKSSKTNTDDEDIPLYSVKKASILLIIGILGVSLGGYMVTTGAEKIATGVLVSLFGMTLSKAKTLVGLSIVAVGTSLPEMVTSIVAAKKGENEIAFGNLVGSNIFNVLFILGLSGLVTPLGINHDVLIDLWIMLGITVFALVTAISYQKVTKREGISLVIIYVLYLAYIILRALFL